MGAFVVQVAEQAAKRCFSDSLLNKAVRESCIRPTSTTGLSSFQSEVMVVKNIMISNKGEEEYYDHAAPAAAALVTAAARDDVNDDEAFHMGRSLAQELVDRQAEHSNNSGSNYSMGESSCSEENASFCRGGSHHHHHHHHHQQLGGGWEKTTRLQKKSTLSSSAPEAQITCTTSLAAFTGAGTSAGGESEFSHHDTSAAADNNRNQFHRGMDLHTISSQFTMPASTSSSSKTSNEIQSMKQYRTLLQSHSLAVPPQFGDHAPTRTAAAAAATTTTTTTTTTTPVMNAVQSSSPNNDHYTRYLAELARVRNGVLRVPIMENLQQFVPGVSKTTTTTTTTRQPMQMMGQAAQGSGMMMMMMGGHVQDSEDQEFRSSCQDEEESSHDVERSIPQELQFLQEYSMQNHYQAAGAAAQIQQIAPAAAAHDELSAAPGGVLGGSSSASASVFSSSPSLVPALSFLAPNTSNSPASQQSLIMSGTGHAGSSSSLMMTGGPLANFSGPLATFSGPLPNFSGPLANFSGPFSNFSGPIGNFSGPLTTGLKLQDYGDLPSPHMVQLWDYHE
jgi:hypothetical protein